MAELTKSAINDALQEYYDEFKLTDLLAIESPFLGMLMRGKFLGRGQPIPMVTDPGQASLSASYSVANTNRAPATFKRFMLEDVRRIYTVGGIDRDVIDLAQTPEAAFADVRTEVDAKLKFTARELASTLWRSENGLCGEISTISEGGGQTTIVVKDPADIRNLGPGARLVGSATAAGALRDSGAVYTVVSVVHSTGTIVVTGTAATTSLWAINDFLHRAGNAPNGGTAVVPSGLADWIVGSGVSATLWRGVDRSVSPDLLAGISLAIGTSSIREACSELAARLMANGGRPDVLWVNTLRFSELEMELDGVATHEKIIPRGVSPEVAAMIGYNAIRIAAGNGSIRIMSDPFCPYKRAYMLTMDTIKFLEIGGKRQPRLRDMGGGDFLQMQDADAVKFQTEAKGDLAVSNPGANGVLTF